MCSKKRILTNDVRDNPRHIKKRKLSYNVYKFADNHSQLIVDPINRTWQFIADPQLKHLNNNTMISMVTEHILANWVNYKQYITPEDILIFFQEPKHIDLLTPNEKLLYISDIMIKAKWFGTDQHSIYSINQVIFDKMDIDNDINAVESILVEIFKVSMNLKAPYTDPQAINTVISAATKIINTIQEITTISSKQPTLDTLIKLSNDYPHKIMTYLYF